MKRTINIRFAEGDRVVLKTDRDHTRVINGYMIRGRHVTYGVAYGENETWHQECEIEAAPAERKRIGLVK